MKHVKSLLAMLVALCLLFGCSTLVFAEDEGTEEPDPAMPAITVQPQDVREGLGKKLVLKVEAEIPNGDEIAYQWYRVIDGISYPMEENTQEANVYMVYPGTGYYYVVVTNRSDASYQAISNTVTVTAYVPWYFWLVPLAFLVAPIRALLGW